MAVVEPSPLTSSGGVAMHLRSATGDDAEAVNALVRGVLEERQHFALLPEEFRKTDAAQRRWIEARRAAERDLLLVVERAPLIVAMVEVVADERARMSHGATLTLLVDRAHRRAGLGEALLRRVVAWAGASHGLERLNLGALSTNAAAIALYRKVGFVEEGRRRGAVKIDGDSLADEILMGLRVT